MKPTILFLVLIIGGPALFIWAFTVYKPSCSAEFCGLKLTDGLLAYFTYCLVVVGAFQGWFLLDAGKAAKATADAASRQARAAVASELPILAFAGQKLIAYDSLGRPVPELDPLPYGTLPSHMMRALVCIKSAGRSNAYLLRYSIRWKVALELPEEPFYGHMAVTNQVIEPNEMTWLVYDRDPIVLSDAERAAINSNQTHLWIYGFLAYGDFMEDMHTIGFSYRWEIVPATGDQPRGLIPDGPPRYRYQSYQQKEGDMTPGKRISHSRPVA